MPQRKIGGRYLLLERIDKGRCSEVLLALDEKEGRQVAAKIGLPRQDRDFVRTVFRNEARALEIGAHPNVVKLLDADARAGEPFTDQNIRSVRPADGLPPKFLGEVLGRRAARNLAAGTPLAWEMIG